MTPSPRQLDVLVFIRDFVAEHRFGPTLDEIAAAIGREKVTAFEHVRGLIRKGFLQRPRGYKARALTITPAGLALLAPRTCPNCSHPLTPDMEVHSHAQQAVP